LKLALGICFAYYTSQPSQTIFQHNNKTTFLLCLNILAGINATAYTQGDDWFAIVDDGNTIHIYNQSDNSLRQTIQIGAE